MEWFQVAILLGVAGVLLANSLVRIPHGHFGIPVRFGRSTGRALYEGYRFKVPLLDSVPPERIYSLKPRVVPVDGRVNTRDGAHVTLSVSVIWKPDPVLQGPSGEIRYLEADEETVHAALKARVGSCLRRCGGDTDATTLLRDPGGFEDCVSGLLRSEHLEPKYGIQIVDAAVREATFAEKSQPYLEGDLIGQHVAQFIRRQLDAGIGQAAALEMAQLVWGLSQKAIREVQGVEQLRSLGDTH